MTMEQLTETIDLDIEESNDLTFKIRLEGTASAPAKVRLVCEGKDMSYMFNGYGTGEDEVVQFTLPKMDSRLVEGMYTSRVEVVVDNKIFVPLNFYLNFKKSLNVVAEAIQVAPKVDRELRVTATPVIPQKPQTGSAVLKFEQRPAAPAPKNESIGYSSLRDVYENRLSARRPDRTDDIDQGTLRQITRALLRDKSIK